MPELPEVEVTRLGLRPNLKGARIDGLRLGKPLRWPLHADPHDLVGQFVADVSRRGKYLLLPLSSGVLLVHLGMSGRLVWSDRADHVGQAVQMGPHDHMQLVTNQGVLTLNDPRRFGAVVFSRSLDDEPARSLLQNLGMEPLSPDFSLHAFRSALQSSRSAIKALLLAGRVVVGVGNIYASEALFLARIHPASPANRVSTAATRRLHEAVVHTLSQAVAMGGTTLRDFHAPNGHSGHFQTATQVYGREGLPCVACGEPIVRWLQGQRSTYFCPCCQRMPRPGPKTGSS